MTSCPVIVLFSFRPLLLTQILRFKGNLFQNREWSLRARTRHCRQSLYTTLVSFRSTQAVSGEMLGCLHSVVWQTTSFAVPIILLRNLNPSDLYNGRRLIVEVRTSPPQTHCGKDPHGNQHWMCRLHAQSFSALAWNHIRGFGRNTRQLVQFPS
ncbi:hypothetical protein DFS34DRAFT_420628 [Phlyctochytrium arcticum]|nr:hypothetical protein DFS34DRAFT_420628 [Phlyctochytrium arcticum]